MEISRFGCIIDPLKPQEGTAMPRLTIVTLASACLLAATPVVAKTAPTATTQPAITAADVGAPPTILVSCGSKAKKGIT